MDKEHEEKDGREYAKADEEIAQDEDEGLPRLSTAVYENSARRVGECK